jgi:AcrR family transcriptional regulator
MQRKLEEKSTHNMASRTANKIVRRQHILTTALKIFNTQGFQNTKITDIIVATNISTASFYKYFSNKRKLFQAILILNIEAEIDHATEHLNSITAIQPQDLLTIFANRANTDSFSELLYPDIIKEFTGYEHDHTVADFYHAKTEHFWRLLIRKLRQGHFIRPSLSDEALLIYFDVWVSYFMDGNKLNKSGQPIIVELLPQITELFLFGMINVDPELQDVLIERLK